MKAMSPVPSIKSLHFIRIYSVLLFTVLACFSLRAQISFDKTYDDTYLNTDVIWSSNGVTTPLVSGGYMSAVTVNDSPDLNIFLVRLNAYGDTLWTKELDTTDIQSVVSIMQDKYGDVIIHGTFDVPGTNYSAENYILKVDTLGNFLNADNITSSGICCWDRGRSNVRSAIDSSYIVGGHSYGISSNNGYIKKLDTAFNVLWTENFGSDYFLMNTGLGSDTTYLLVGRRYSSVKNAKFLKVDDQGTLVFTKTYMHPLATESYFHDVVEVSGGYLLVGGYEDVNGDPHVWLMRTDVNGDSIQNVSFPSSRIYISMKESATGGFLLFGDHFDGFGLSDYHLTVLDNNLNITAEYNYVDAEHNLLHSVEATVDGGYVLSGISGPNGVFNKALHVIKIDSSYCLIPTFGPNTPLVQDTICAGDSVFFSGSYYSQPGIHQAYLPDVNGCDSLTALDLFVLPYDTGLVSETICVGDSVIFYGTAYTTPGTYYATVGNPGNCDSLYVLSLAVSEDTTNLSLTICQGDSVQIGNSTYHLAGSYMAILSNQNGCDSVINLSLSVLPLDTVFVSETLCYGDSLSMGGFTYTQTGLYYPVFTDENGCDSTVNLSVVVLPADSTSTSASICDGDTLLFSGNAYTTAGIFYPILPNQNGCDSVIELIISVLPLDTAFHYAEICPGDSVLFNGLYHSTGGTYYQTNTNMNGCDSTDVLVLTVYPPLSLYLGPDTTLCEPEILTLTANSGISYVWSTGETTQSIVVSDSGLYSVVVTDLNGCFATDSILVDVDDCTTVSETERNTDIQVYPNPAINRFYIDLGQIHGAVTISVVNGAGEVVLTETHLGEEIIDIDVSTINSGLYTVIIATASSRVTTRLIRVN